MESNSQELPPERAAIAQCLLIAYRRGLQLQAPHTGAQSVANRLPTLPVIHLETVAAPQRKGHIEIAQA